MKRCRRCSKCSTMKQMKQMSGWIAGWIHSKSSLLLGINLEKKRVGRGKREEAHDEFPLSYGPLCGEIEKGLVVQAQAKH